MSISRIQSKLTAIYMLIAVLSAGGVLVSTANHGIGYGSDSFSYIAGAQALIHTGLSADTIYLSHHPPLQSLVLVVLGLNLQLVLLLNMALLAANVLLLAYLLTQVEVKPWISIMVLLAVGFAPELVFRHSMVMSEPLFLLLLQLTLIMMVKGRLGWAVVFAALVPLQRYAGIAFVGACVLYILWRYDLKRAVLFGAVTTLPVALWLFRGALVTETAGRTIALHPISFNHLVQGALTLGGRFWFFPAALMVVALVYTNRKRLRMPAIPQVIVLSGLFIAMYLAFLVVSISLFDFNTPLDSRILSPVLLLGWLIVAWFVSGQFDLPVEREHRVLGAVFAMMMFGFLMFGTIRMAQSNQMGVGLIRDVEPEYFEVIAALPRNQQIYTNETPIMIFMRHIDGRINMGLNNLPEKYDAVSQITNPHYAEELARLRAEIEQGETLVVWFMDSTRRNIVSMEELMSLPYQDIDGLRIFGTLTGAES